MLALHDNCALFLQTEEKSKRLASARVLVVVCFLIVVSFFIFVALSVKKSLLRTKQIATLAENALKPRGLTEAF